MENREFGGVVTRGWRIANGKPTLLGNEDSTAAYKQVARSPTARDYLVWYEDEILPSEAINSLKLSNFSFSLNLCISIYPIFYLFIFFKKLDLL